MKNKRYYCLFSDSENSCRDLNFKVAEFTDEKIIELAKAEHTRAGTSFEEQAGFTWIYDSDGRFIDYAETMTDVLQLQLAIKKLGDDGRFFQVYSDTDTDLSVVAGSSTDFLSDCLERGEILRETAKNLL